MMVKRRILIGYGIILLLLPLGIARGESEYSLGLRRLFGYGGGMDIRGSFLLSLRGPVENIKEVTFFVDDSVLSIVTTAPFEVKFNTDNFANGEHNISAMVATLDGNSITVPPLRYRFLSGSEESDKTQGILFPLLGGIFAVMTIGLLVQWIGAGRRKSRFEPGAERNYGWLGGAICPKCQRPTPLHLSGFNVGLGKYDRCENCGKWSVMRRASADALRAAELKELADSQSSVAESQSRQQTEEQRIEDSRYLDS